MYMCMHKYNNIIMCTDVESYYVVTGVAIIILLFIIHSWIHSHKLALWVGHMVVYWTIICVCLVLFVTIVIPYLYLQNKLSSAFFCIFIYDNTHSNYLYYII